jgi:hypothetical protein
LVSPVTRRRTAVPSLPVTVTNRPSWTALETTALGHHVLHPAPREPKVIDHSHVAHQNNGNYINYNI